MNNENELTALALTIEKCREIIGCPAGVDLQDWVTQLAAENVALKQAAEFATASDMWIEQADGMLDYRYHEWYVDVLKTAMETPATDRIVAAQRSAFVDEAVAKITESGALTFGDCIVALCQLREGAK
ncbi:hypothetical protein V3N80_25285 [Raoultella planticola]|uniref:hypothetical protein n=1 Tax=Raoultella planticola TaxID=575 RepID=UPI002F315290